MSAFYLTTPIYYLNGLPHIGHAYTTILADVIARFHRLEGVDTYFLTGTDEHGQKVYLAARKAGISPQEHTDRLVEEWKAVWRRLLITNDDFIRTTEPRHEVVVQRILQDLYDRGEIYKGEYRGWYAVSEERFYTEKDLVDGKSPEGNPVEEVVETNYFFRMSRYRDWLVRYIEEHPEFIQPDFRRNETLGFLRQELRDLCISRPKSRIPWGIELPWDRDQTCYVWFDALVNYISAAGYTTDDEKFARLWPADCHLIGKDILTTHTVYWPTMLQAIGLPQPRTIFAHGWWLTGGEKMAKSRGNVVDPLDMLDRHGIDAVRYHLIAEMSLGQDASFSEESFVRRYNTDLANDLGNLASRVLKMIHRSAGGRIPEPVPEADGRPEEELRRVVQSTADDVMAHVRAMAPDRAVSRIMETVRAGNRYFDQRAPWTLAREGKTAELGNVLYHGAECLRVVSGLLSPVIPGKAEELRRSLGLTEAGSAPGAQDLRRWGVLQPGVPVGAAAPLFPRIAPKADATPSGERPRSRGGARSEAGGGSDEAPEGTVISIEDFGRVELRVGRVVAAEPVEGADRLLRLEVDLGRERRQIVAGIAPDYGPDEVRERLVVVVTNLAPAVIRGVRSEGMLLAAKKGKRLRLVTVDGEIPPGARVG